MNRATYTIEEAAELLGIGRSSAYRAARDGQIPAIRLGRRLLVPKVALERLLNGMSANQAGQAVAKAVDSVDSA